MTATPESRLERLLRRGVFCVTSEVVPPRSSNGEAVTRQALALVGYADAANVTDNPTSSAHMSSVAGTALVARTGVEPVVQLTCRDRNRLALTADLLGAWALGARNVLCLTGDPTSGGDDPQARSVFDLSVIDLIGLAVRLRDEGRLLTGEVADPPPRYFVGVADVPLVDGYDFARLEQKADAGATFVQTQIVFDMDRFEAWAAEAMRRGIFERMFVLAGVAVPATPRSARFIRDHLPGVSVPDVVIERLEDAGDDAAAEGVKLAADIVARLRRIEGIAGVHVMGLGRMEPVQRLVEAARLLPRPGTA